VKPGKYRIARREMVGGKLVSSKDCCRSRRHHLPRKVENQVTKEMSQERFVLGSHKPEYEVSSELRDKLSAFVEDPMNRRAEILDEFCKTYLAARSDWLKANPERIKRLELVRRPTTDGAGWIYSFRFKRGRSKTPVSSTRPA
jgi:hypothetical protein